ncbi:phosphatase PAP2 family protein [Hwanghaeella grinnelliae]|uniref:Phosphatase PAP2 family protein n=1 Tax=Hwanghaeella grinnelliae TaxID=2500179 RepID=A0A437QX31_9PROT|nr:phosphatase PAP2 family protein [Hwanghaeella grinnelliae]RVU39081.1 phosphatase PAP2 family protein [Hwanghaeella grinnelliae]
MPANSRTIIVLATAALLLTLGIFGFTEVDLAVQDRLFDAATGSWIWDKHEPVARMLFYTGPKLALVALAAACLLTLLASGHWDFARKRRQGLAVLLISLIIVPAAAGALKTATNVACPARSDRYGGNVPTISLFERYPDDARPADRQRCFPAGHASGGFALFALVFMFKGRAARRVAVVIALTVGGAMAAYKMAIGDHFLSHTLVTMELAAILVALIASAAVQVERHFGRLP